MDSEGFGGGCAGGGGRGRTMMGEVEAGWRTKLGEGLRGLEGLSLSLGLLMFG